MKRVLTALALIPIVVYVVLWANFWIFLAVLFAVACLCYREYDSTSPPHYGFGAPGIAGCGRGLPAVRVAWRGLALPHRRHDRRPGRRDAHGRPGEDALPRAALLITGIVYVFGCWKCAHPAARGRIRTG